MDKFVKLESGKYLNAYTIGKAIVVLVKILKQYSDNPTQEEVLEPFKIAVAREFGVTKEEYYKQKASDKQ